MESGVPSPELSELNRRVIDMEIKLTHQDATIDELNKVIIRQQQQIDRLGDELGKARQRLDELDSGSGAGSQYEPPPHY